MALNTLSYAQILMTTLDEAAVRDMCTGWMDWLSIIKLVSAVHRISKAVAAFAYVDFGYMLINGS